MSFYTQLASTAKRLIDSYGQEILLTDSNDSINPVTGATTTGIKRVYKTSGILKTYPDNLIDGTRIKSSDRLLVLNAGVEPEMDFTVELNDQQWTIQEIKSSDPAGTAIVYFVQVRR